MPDLTPALKRKLLILAASIAMMMFFLMLSSNRRGSPIDVEWANIVAESGLEQNAVLSVNNAAPILLQTCAGLSPTMYQRILSIEPSFSYTDSRKMSFLHTCFNSPHWSQLAERALNAGVDINSLDQEQHTPLMNAVMGGHLDASIWLKQHGANINATDSDGNPLFFLAKTDTLPLLAQWGLDDESFRNNLSQTVLMVAIIKGDTKRAEYLLKGAPSLELQDKYGKTALHYAAENNMASIVKSIVQRNVDLIYIEDKQHDTPIELANGESRRILNQYSNPNASDYSYGNSRHRD